MRILSLFFMLALSSISAFAADRYLAKDAALSGDATLNGNYVQMKEGSLTFNAVSVSSAGMYDMLIHYKNNYGGSKIQNLVVNGTTAGEIAFPLTADGEWEDVVSALRLNEGNNVIAITKSWGWVDIEYIEISPHENVSFDLKKELANPNANDAAKKVFAFMQDKFQKKIISGAMTNDVLSGNNAVEFNNQTEISFIRASSGNKTPAIVGFDFMHGTGKEYKEGNAWFKNYTDATISLAKEIWNKGGIPTYSWHWRDPLKKNMSFYSPSSGNESTDFDLTNACINSSCTAWNTSSPEYLGIIEDIDIVADYLKELQDAGVAVLWRPVHEPSGGWFWWGYKGAAPFKLLYNLLFDRLTNHHNLNNLIWVWNSEGGGDKDWYPGDNYVDIIGRDFYYYPAQKNHASLIGEFEKLKNSFGTTKMIALSENGSIPYPENLIEDGASWSFFMPWYGEHTGINDNSSHNVASDWNKVMNHEYVITLGDMPGWANYEPPTPTIPIAPKYAAAIDLKTLDFSKAQVYNMRGSKMPVNSYENLKGLPIGVYIVKTSAGRALYTSK